MKYNEYLNETNPRVKIDMGELGEITLELFPSIAPIASPTTVLPGLRSTVIIYDRAVSWSPDITCPLTRIGSRSCSSPLRYWKLPSDKDTHVHTPGFTRRVC